MTDLDAKYYRENSSFQYDAVQEILKTLNFNGSETLLDIGCGDGRITAEISKLLPEGAVFGIDSSPSMIELSQKSFPKNKYPNLSFFRTAAEEMHLDIKADLILVMNTLHWIREPIKALQKISDHLKPNGLLYILTYPKESPYWNFLERTAEEAVFQPFCPLKSILTTQETKSAIESLNLQLEECHLEERVAVYKTPLDLMNYIKGWLHCYLPLPAHLENTFLQKAAQNASSSNKKSEEIHLPFLRLLIKAKKSSLTLL